MTKNVRMKQWKIRKNSTKSTNWGTCFLKDFVILNKIKNRF